MPHTIRTRAFLLALLLVAGHVPAAQAQIGAAQVPAPAPNPPPVAAPAEVAVAPDSPRAAFQSFLEAARATRWDDAARFLSLNASNRERGPELAMRLTAVIDSLFSLDPDSIAATPQGRLDDNLPPDLEEIAQVRNDGVAEPMRLVRVPRGDGVFWRFAPATTARIDDWFATLPGRWLREEVIALGPAFLLRAGPLGILWWQWIALPMLAIISWGIGHLLRFVTHPILVRLTTRTANRWDDQVAAAFGPPMTLILAIATFVVGALLIQIPRSGLLKLAPPLRAAIAFALFWALWRGTEILISWSMSRSWAARSASVRSLLAIGSNLLRASIVASGFLAMLAAFGYPVVTVLAGLGLGGLAIVFGAQKTVENLFGSIALAVDQPFHVGDLVRVNDLIGTVEDIGLRSTRIRTADRTVVSIPNGKLADERLESFEVRDRMRLDAIVGLTYGTTRQQMQTVLDGINRILVSHPRIWPDGITVKFKALGQSSLDIEVGAWFHVPTWGDFQQCRQDVLLGFMDVVEKAGTRFAFPTRTVHVVQEGASAV